MTDEREDGEPQDGPADGRRPGPASGHPGYGRFTQRNLAGRLFPGPSPRMSNQMAERIEGLLNPIDTERRAGAWRDKRSSASATEGDRQNGTARRQSPSAIEPTTAVAPEDIAQLRATLDEQSELLRAILASTVDTQTDARATAQNSRTFAWAGTAIALLTLIATVISVVAAVRAN